MNLKELSSPIRMYWDIGPARNAVVSDYGRIAREIAACKILSLQVTESAPKLSQPCLTILDALKDNMIALSLVAPLTALDAQSFGSLRTPLKLLLVSTDTQAELASISRIKKQVDGRPPVGIAFSVTRANFRELPDVLSFCVDHGITNLVLPMQRLTGDAECFSFSAEERWELTARLNTVDRPAWLKIIIHDPFLWRAFYPSIDFPEGGCQAANTMLFISPEADVYPCPSLPVKIGSLQKTSLKEVINSDRKKDLRKSLLVSPSDCASCGELNQCKGGCRGRAYTLRSSLTEPDPACK